MTCRPVHRPCLCLRYCGDVDEPEDGPPPWPICKGLPVFHEPLIEVVLVHRDDLKRGPGGEIA